jgi:fusion and transport protein UGO1
MRGKTPKRTKKVKRQHQYESSSEEEGGALDAPRERAQPKPKLSTRFATGANAVKALPEESKNAVGELPEESENAVEALPEESKNAVEAIIEESKTAVEAIREESKTAVDAILEASKDAVDTLPEASEESSLDEQDEFEIEEEDSDGDQSGDSEDSELSETSTTNARKVRKRNDPEAFATSMSKILGTKLTSQKRSEPILSRSKTAQETNKSLADHKLTLKANRAVIAEKKAAQEKGRVKDVLGLQKADVSTAEIVAEEKRLRRTAQKGVIKLFNAVRAAQVKGEQAEKEARQKGVVGLTKREEKVKEMSKQGFLDMIAGGGKKKEGSVEA